MLYREIIAICSEIHKKKHMNKLCGQNVEFFCVKPKKLENVKCFKYLGSMLTDDGRCTCEIAMAKAAFNEKENLFTSKLDLNLRK